MITLGVVVPCYNEEQVLPETTRRLLAMLNCLMAQGQIAPDSRIYYVDDGSKDGTWELIEACSRGDTHVAGIKLSRNRGHQNALLAGLFTAPGDALISIDADLQDDVEAIGRMVHELANGAEIVYGVRQSRNTDARLKRSTAQGFYRLMHMLGAEVVYNHADYRLMSRRAIEALKQFREVNLFLRGIVPLIGFRSACVYYTRAERYAGASKYPFRRMLTFALEGVTSFSITPLRLITGLGMLVFALTLLMSAYALGARLLTNATVPGWTSVVLPMYLLGGIQLFCIGVLGEYLGKIYHEVKARPRYIIEKCLNF
ncbi:MAG TPA: glycosyltransferase family 2 protein [Candidatus Tectomicrobia bacterium]